LTNTCQHWYILIPTRGLIWLYVYLNFFLISLFFYINILRHNVASHFALHFVVNKTKWIFLYVRIIEMRNMRNDRCIVSNPQYTRAVVWETHVQCPTIIPMWLGLPIMASMCLDMINTEIEHLLSVYRHATWFPAFYLESLACTWSNFFIIKTCNYLYNWCFFLFLLAHMLRLRKILRKVCTNLFSWIIKKKILHATISGKYL